MSKRLQVLVSEEEFQKAQRCAASEDMSVSEWVRSLVRRAGSGLSVKSVEQKQEALRKALLVNAPTCDIDQMLREIEEGYEVDLPGL